MFSTNKILYYHYTSKLLMQREINSPASLSSPNVNTRQDTIPENLRLRLSVRNTETEVPQQNEITSHIGIIRRDDTENRLYQLQREVEERLEVRDYDAQQVIPLRQLETIREYTPINTIIDNIEAERNILRTNGIINHSSNNRVTENRQLVFSDLQRIQNEQLSEHMNNRMRIEHALEQQQQSENALTTITNEIATHTLSSLTSRIGEFFNNIVSSSPYTWVVGIFSALILSVGAYWFFSRKRNSNYNINNRNFMSNLNRIRRHETDENDENERRNTYNTTANMYNISIANRYRRQMEWLKKLLFKK